MVARFFFPRLTVVFPLLLPITPLTAGVEVNAPVPFTNTVTVQPYRAVRQDGTAAVVMGDSTSEAYIKKQINLVLSQSGISVDWLPVIDLVDDFLYDGSPNDYTRTIRPVGAYRNGEFYDIISCTPSSTTILKIYFVEIVPGYRQTSDATANGYAYIDFNGVAIHIGASLPGTMAGRDVAASVIAHEISHNLGLVHVGSTDNLMYATNRTSERLTTKQTDIIFTENDPFDGYQLLGAHSHPSKYSLWASDLGVTGAPDADDDHDGLANVIEFMLGLDGSRADHHAQPVPIWSPAGLTWTLEKQQDALDDGLQYRIEVSSDANHWNPAGTAGSGSTVLADSTTTYSVRLDASSPMKYMRITVNLAESLLGGSQSLPETERAEGFETDDLAHPTTPPRSSYCGVHGCGHRSVETP